MHLGNSRRSFLHLVKRLEILRERHPDERYAEDFNTAIKSVKAILFGLQDKRAKPAKIKHKVIKSYESGLLIKRICHLFRVGNRTVNRWVREEGVPYRTRHTK